MEEEFEGRRKERSLRVTEPTCQKPLFPFVLAFSSNLSPEPCDHGVGNYEEKSLKINHLDPARLRLQPVGNLNYASQWSGSPTS